MPRVRKERVHECGPHELFVAAEVVQHDDRIIRPAVALLQPLGLHFEVRAHFSHVFQLDSFEYELFVDETAFGPLPLVDVTLCKGRVRVSERSSSKWEQRIGEKGDAHHHH